MPSPFAEDPYIAPVESEPVLVEINARMIPMVIRALNKYKYRKSWVSDEDFDRGLAEINILEVALLTGTQTIVDALDRLYRLIDTSYNGTAYTAAADPVTGEIQVAPLIAAVPPVSTSAPNAMRANITRLWQLSENTAAGQVFAAGAGMSGSVALSDNQSTRAVLRGQQGILNSGWFNGAAVPATYADIVAALRPGSDEQVENLVTALDLLQGSGSAAVIFNTVREFLSDGADLTVDGLMLSTMIVATMAQAATAGIQAGQMDALQLQIDRLVASLDGGADPRPADNVLALLAQLASTPATDYSADLAAITGLLTTGNTQRGIIRDSNIAIRNAIGAIEQIPANWTVKRLLARLIECACEAPEEIDPEPPIDPELPPSNEFPEDACMVVANAYQAVAWVRLSGTLALPSDTLIADFGDLSAIGLTRAEDNNGVPYYTYGAVQPPGQQSLSESYCVAWNWTGETSFESALNGITVDPQEMWAPTGNFSSNNASDQITIFSDNGSADRMYFRCGVRMDSAQSSILSLSMWIGLNGIG